MKPTFTNYHKPLLTVMLQCETPELILGRIRNALCDGAEAFGLQAEWLKPEYQTPEVYQQLIREMRDRPCYVTNYRGRNNGTASDEVLAEGLLTWAKCGASLCDVPGDHFCKHPLQLTDDPEAIRKQMALIDKLHAQGAQVLMSSHIFTFTPAQKVLEVALEQKRRGADVVKIVTGADTMEQQIENLRITHLLKEELGIPFLFLSGGQCSLHRRLGIHLGCCMALCTYEHDALSSFQQPLLRIMRSVRDDMGF